MESIINHISAILFLERERERERERGREGGREGEMPVISIYCKVDNFDLFWLAKLLYGRDFISTEAFRPWNQLE